MEEFIINYYDFAVFILQALGGFTNTGYMIANFVIFVFLQPGLALLFFYLWRKEVKGNRLRLSWLIFL